MENVSRIKTKYKLEAVIKEDIIAELKNKAKVLHPDYLKRELSNDESDLYNEIISDIKNLRDDNFDIITLSSNDIAVFIKDLAKREDLNKQNQIDTKLSQCVTNNITVSRRMNNNIKVPSGVISGVFTGAFLFPDQIMNHPILGQYINITSSQFVLSWLMVLGVTAELWFLTWTKEQRLENKLKRLSSLDTQNELFERFIFELGRKNINQFSRVDLKMFMRDKSTFTNKHGLYKMFFSSHGVDEEIFEIITDAILNRARARNIIREVESYSLNERYELTMNNNIID
jgi:hypothetical protein